MHSPQTLISFPEEVAIFSTDESICWEEERMLHGSCNRSRSHNATAPLNECGSLSLSRPLLFNEEKIRRISKISRIDANEVSIGDLAVLYERR